MRAYHRCLITPACVDRRELKAKSVSACPYLVLVVGVEGYVLARVEIGVLSIFFSVFAGVRMMGGCVRV